MGEAVSTCPSFTAGWEGGSTLWEKIPDTGDTKTHQASSSTIPWDEAVQRCHPHPRNVGSAAAFLIAIFVPPFPSLWFN